MRFVDTNVLLYAISTAPEEKRKTRVARELLEDRDLALSVQVLHEFYIQSTRPNRPHSLNHEQAVRFIEAVLRYPVQDLTIDLTQAALSAAARFRISFWDAVIVESARTLGCDVILTEDLNHGQSYGGVTVQNPFRRV